MGAWSPCPDPIAFSLKKISLPSHSLVKHPFGELGQSPDCVKLIPNSTAAFRQSWTSVIGWFPKQSFLPRLPLINHWWVSKMIKREWNLQLPRNLIFANDRNKTILIGFPISLPSMSQSRFPPLLLQSFRQQWSVPTTHVLSAHMIGLAGGHLMRPWRLLQHPNPSVAPLQKLPSLHCNILSSFVGVSQGHFGTKTHWKGCCALSVLYRVR